MVGSRSEGEEATAGKAGAQAAEWRRAGGGHPSKRGKEEADARVTGGRCQGLEFRFLFGSFLSCSEEMCVSKKVTGGGKLKRPVAKTGWREGLAPQVSRVPGHGDVPFLPGFQPGGLWLLGNRAVWRWGITDTKEVSRAAAEAGWAPGIGDGL